MSEPEDKPRKTLVGVYEPDADWILKHRNDRPFKKKGNRKRENTADVVSRVVEHYKETKEP